MPVTTKLQLDVVKPEGAVLSQEIEECIIPGAGGLFGVRPGHAPFLTVLGTGELSYRAAGQTRYLAIAGGFCEVQPERVTVLAEIAERAEDIDSARATRARDRAEVAMRAAIAAADEAAMAEARAAFERARVRLTVASRKVGVAA